MPPGGEGGAAGFGGERDTRESKAELHGGHDYLQPVWSVIGEQKLLGEHRAIVYFDRLY